MFVGYAIGYYAIEMAMPFIAKLGYADQFESISRRPRTDWPLLIAGFTPIPFKIFTLASGAVGMPLAPFRRAIGAASAYLVAGAIRLGGEKAEVALRRHIEPVGWIALVLFVGLIAWLWLRHQGA
ncbi:hypothetical protein [Arenimonas sp.]|uniref:hypothetical protein n=1 Tax=Arenimonas sp. TaxID=1872635 RepID=UPI0039E39C34